MDSARRRSFWTRVLWLTGTLLAVWLLANLVGPWFAPDLHPIRFFRFPFSFWVATQGALLLYLAIIVVYVVVMERLEDDFLRAEAEAGLGTGKDKGMGTGTGKAKDTR